jgi:spermidine synthase
MSTTPVAVLLLLNAALLVSTSVSSRQKGAAHGTLLISLLFFLSGMPALIYQVVWQRTLFLIYGVNAQSVAVVVTAFMLGLGLGSFAGGALSKRFPRHGILLFGIAELAIAAFGILSLPLFHKFAAYTAGANLASVIAFSLILLLIPTMLMGATLPLLVEHLVKRASSVGTSVSTLYFVNTFGSAVACYLCASFLLRSFGQSGTVMIAACVNTAVGLTAYSYARSTTKTAGATSTEVDESIKSPAAAIGLPKAMLLAGLSGFVALGFEIAWFRVFALASSDRAPAFALLLATYLAGVAAGSFVAERVLYGREAGPMLRFIAVAWTLAGALSAYLPPLVAALMKHQLPFLASAPAFFLVAALTGSVLPLLCQIAVPANDKAGQGVSLIYVSNILGSAMGSLGIGFLLMQVFSLRQIAFGLGFLAVLMGAGVLAVLWQRERKADIWAWAATVAAAAAVPAAGLLYPLLFERLIFGNRPEAQTAFANIVENRNTVVGVTEEGAIFGGGVYDGYFNVDPLHDSNLVSRIYALSAFCANPKRILVIGLSGGSWGQILANHPQTEVLDAVEINPGYLDLIPKYPMVRSFLRNPKVTVYVDDGRRWLLAHPDARYDAIIANTTYNWRDHSSGLLSVEFLKLIRAHLNPGGIYYFNTTESEETIATALHVFPHGLRVINFVAVSDSPLILDKERWARVLGKYRIDGKTPFDPADPQTGRVLAAYMLLADTVSGPPRFFGMESSESLRKRLGSTRIITDDNMGTEWNSAVQIPWH